MSLARSCQVNRNWNNIGNDKILWKRLCFLSKYRFSLETENKQFEKYKNLDDSIQVKKHFNSYFTFKNLL